MSALPNLTNCGLVGLQAIPYGLHMCHFYERRDDLASALVPYFIAGLHNNERCIWTTADPLDVAGAEEELRKAGLDLPAVNGALTIRDHADWFGPAESWKPEDMVGRWLEEERRALADGYSGLRISENASFVTPANWSVFMAYEELMDRELPMRRTITLCSYRLAQCAAIDLLDVARRHHCMLDQAEPGWQVVTARNRDLGSLIASAATPAGFASA